MCCSKKCAADIQKPKWEDIVALFISREYDLLSKEYTTNKTKLEYVCRKHADMGVQSVTYNNLKSGSGCKYCGYERTATHRRLSFEEVRSIFDKNDMILLDGQEYRNSNQKMAYICKQHQNIGVQYMTATNAYKNHCPYCNIYKGEAGIMDYFLRNNVKFESQKRYPGLVGVGDRSLSYDFYLPDYDLLIEYQGQYHDGTARNQTTEDYIKQVEHDRRKRDYATTNGIGLLEIWYNDYSNIDTILANELSKQKE